LRRLWQNSPVTQLSRGHVVVVGSGLAGLSAAVEAARGGCRVTVVTPARAGRDGSSHRVHALAPWILLTAPWVRGDSPGRFLADLRRRGDGLQRDELTACFADHAHDAAVALCEALDLVRLDREPVTLPGDGIARGQRCLPRAAPLLVPMLAECARLGVQVRERSLAVGLLLAGDRVTGALVLDRSTGDLIELRCEAVVLACGGVGAVFPRATAPRWCRGSGLALAAAAGALLHAPNLTQTLPVTATPPLYFPTTAALLGGRILLGGEPLRRIESLDAATVEIAGALRRGEAVTLDPGLEDGLALLPQRVQESHAFQQDKRVPLTVAVHHAIGGVAIDRSGRTSLSGLYACGEAAGGVQGRRRTMGTGLLEAWIFGQLAGTAAATDAARSAGAEQPSGGAESRAAAPALAEDPERLERAIDRLLGPLTCVRPADETASALAELETWPVARETRGGDSAWLAAIRRGAALVMLRAEIDCDEPVTAAGVPQGEGER
jgi:succinate dehydrogenase/fumarate reductase flavoprotein subunit